MLKQSLVFLFLLPIVVFFSSNARADQPINLIQTLCIPEPGIDYFSVRLQSFDEIANYGVNNEDHRKVLEKYGLLPTRKFSYTCKLLHHTYTITGHRPPHREKGQCGGDPRVVLSLKRDDETVLDQVFFEPSCFSELFDDSHPYIESIVVEDEISSAHDQYVQVILSDGLTKKSTRLHETFKSLNHDQLYCLGEKGFFKKKGRFASARELDSFVHCEAPQPHKHGAE